MSRRVRDLSLCLAALAGGAVLALAVGNAPPVGAQAPSTASIEAYDFGWRDAATGNSSTAVAPGGTVTFSYPSGVSFHNVVFSDLQPTTCSQTAGNDTGAVPPLPANADVAGWSGTCRFDNPGAYAFVCGAHPSMSGTVNVGDPGGTTTTPPAGTTPAPPGDTTPGDTTPGDTTPDGSPAPPKVSVARSQRGVVLRGAVTTPAGPSRIVVTAFASSRSLAGRAARRVRVGFVSKRSAGTGRTRFAVRLKAAARSALRRRGRLVVSLRIVVTAPNGHAVTKSIAVTVRSS